MSRSTFLEISEQWKSQKRPYVKLSTYAMYLTLLNRHLLPAFGESRNIREEEVQTFVETKYREGLSSSTIHLVVLVLRMILRYGARSGLCADHDWKIRYRAAQGTSLPLLSPRQHELILSHLRNHPSPKGLGIYLSLSTGIRIGEACALRWEDLDFADGLLHISKTCSRICCPEMPSRTLLQIGPPKTPSSVREIPLPDDLKGIIARLDAGKAPAHFVLTDSPFPIEPRSYRNYYQALLAGLGIQPLRFHALRHSFATRCIEAGCDCKTVSEILGHAKVSTTMALYVHPGFKQKKDCIEKVNSLHLG